MATSPELELVWDGGSLDLMGENETPYGPVLIQALADGTEWGNPQSIRRALFSALADGSASVTDRHDNRTVVVKLQLSAADSAALAAGESPLHLLATKRRAELRWTPPNESAAPAAYIIAASDLAHVMDDLGENKCRRQYVLTLTCLPFARSIAPVVIEALGSFVAAPTVLNDCSTTTGWTTPANGSIGTAGGVVTVTPGYNPPVTLDACTSTTGWGSTYGSPTFAVVSGAVEISATYGGSGVAKVITNLTKTLARSKRYLAVESQLVAGSNPDPTGLLLRVRTAGGWLPGYPAVAGTEGAWTFFDIPSTLGAVLEMEFSHYLPSSGGPHIVWRILTIAESDFPAASSPKVWSVSVTGVTKPYLAIESNMTDAVSVQGQVGAGPSTTLVLAGSEGAWRFYDAPSGLTKLNFSQPSSAAVQYLTIAHSDVPAASSGRQSLRVIATPGSARADGSLTIESRDATTVGGGTPQGQTIVYTGPEYDPRLSVGRTDAATVDTTALSGKKVTKTNGTFTFDVPAAGFLDGSHGLWVHAKGTNGQVVNWTVAVDAIPVGSPAGQYLNLAANTLTATTTFVGTGYNLLNLGSLDLPGFNAGEGSALGLRVRIGVSGTVDLDEVLVFNRSLGRLTIIDTRTRQSLLEVAGAWTIVTNGGATRVWLEAPDVGSDAPRLLAGSPSRALALPVSQSTELRSFDGTHIFNPGSTFVYVGTTGVLDPLVTGTFRPAWHTHPAS